MAVGVDSWSTPELPGLIGRKQVDWTIFETGTHLPLRIEKRFREANEGASLERGQSHRIELQVGDHTYKATLSNLSKSDREIGYFVIEYGSNAEFRQLLQSTFAFSYAYIQSRREKQPEPGRQQRIKVPSSKAEYIDFFATGVPYRYRLELRPIAAGQPVRNPPWSRDELILALDLYFRVNPVHTSPQHPEIQKLSQLLNKLPVHKDQALNANYRNANGVYMKLCNFLRLDPAYGKTGLDAGSKLDEVVWHEFAGDRKRLEETAAAIREHLALQGDAPRPVEMDLWDDEDAPEGRVLLREHRIRERRREIVKKKKAQALKQFGVLRCEVCGLSFEEIYGKIGQGYIECHHRVPLSQLAPGTHTRPEDLALVCANCHRMLHAGGRVRTVEELRQVVLHFRQLRRAAQHAQEVAAAADESSSGSGKTGA